MQTGSSNESSRSRAKGNGKTAAGKATKRSKADAKNDTLHLKTKHLVATPADSACDMASMIATAAYYRAAQRGFEPGHELDDWLQAEQLVRSQAPS
jgi:hypothetical protein